MCLYESVSQLHLRSSAPTDYLSVAVDSSGSGVVAAAIGMSTAAET